MNLKSVGQIKRTARRGWHKWAMSGNAPNADPLPDPPTLACLKKARETPGKGKGFSLHGIPKILGKGRKNAQKRQGKSGNKKSKEIKKSKDWRFRARKKKCSLRRLSCGANFLVLSAGGSGIGCNFAIEEFQDELTLTLQSLFFLISLIFF